MEPEARVQRRSSGMLAGALLAALLLEASMYSVLTPLLPALTDSYYLDKAQAGYLYSAYVVAFTLGILVGAWGVPRRGLRGAARASLITFAFGCALFAVSGSVWMAGLGRFVSGLAGGFAWVAILTWLARAAGPDKRGATIGRAFSVAVVGTLAGPLLGNLALTIGIAPVFWAVAAVSVAIALVVPEDPAESVDELTVPGAPAHHRGGHLYRRIVAMSALAVTYGALLVILPLRLADQGLTAISIGWLFALSAVAAAFVNRLSGVAADRMGTVWLSLISALGTVVVLLAIAAVDSLLIGVIAVVIGMGIVVSLGLTPNATAVSLAAGGRGMQDVSVSVLVLILFAGGESLGALAAPVMARELSDSTTFAMLAALNAVALAALTSIVVMSRRHAKSASRAE